MRQTKTHDSKNIDLTRGANEARLLFCQDNDIAAASLILGEPEPAGRPARREKRVLSAQQS